MADEVADLGVAGRRLYDALHSETDSYSVTAMLIEACRVKDRLDKLDLLLRGDIETWVALTHDLRTEDYELKINSAAAESRQQATVLRQLLSEVARQKDPTPDPGGGDDLDGL